MPRMPGRCLLSVGASARESNGCSISHRNLLELQGNTPYSALCDAYLHVLIILMCCCRSTDEVHIVML